MGNCLSNRVTEKHTLEIDTDNKSFSSNNKYIASVHKSFPQGLERKSMKNKAPIIDGRVESSITKDAPDAIISHKPKLQDDLDLIYNSLNRHFIFKNLSQEQQDLIMHEMKYYSLPASSYIIEQGKPGNNFFVIASGRVEVLVNNARVNILISSNSFGEMALLQDKPRSASVRTLEVTNL